LNGALFAESMAIHLLAIFGTAYLWIYRRSLREDPEYCAAQFFLNPQGRRLFTFLAGVYFFLSVFFMARVIVRNDIFNTTATLVGVGAYATFFFLSVRWLSKPAGSPGDIDALADGHARSRDGGLVR
jgi:hypothetical protein